ncbi:lipid A biosynthesis acyltransferase, partial [Acinetobacter baumannii]
MTRPDSKSMNYQLLKTFSRLPIQFGRSIARLLAGLVNTLKITKTSKSIELNLRIALPHLTPQ